MKVSITRVASIIRGETASPSEVVALAEEVFASRERGEALMKSILDVRSVVNHAVEQVDDIAAEVLAKIK